MNAQMWLAGSEGPDGRVPEGACQPRSLRPRARWLLGEIAFLVALATRPGFGAGVDYGSYIHWLGTAPIGATVLGVAVQGEVAYVAHAEGLSVIDVASPSAPLVVGGVGLPGTPVSVAVAGRYAYVVGTFGAVYAVDVAVPQFPWLVGMIELQEQLFAVASEGGRAFVAADAGDLYVIDMSVPEAPVVESHLILPGEAQGIMVRNGLAYVAGGSAGLHVVDVVDPGAPVLLGTGDIGDYGSSIDVALTVAADGVNTTYAYVAVRGWGAGLFVIDVSNPADPLPVGAALLAPLLSPSAVAVTGGHVLVSTGRGTRVYDPSDPTTPIPISSVDLEAIDIAAEGNRAYLADYYTGLHVIDISSVKGVTPLASVQHEAVNVAVDGRYAHTMDAQFPGGAVRVIDLEYPGGPTVLAEIPVDQGWGMAWRAPYLYFEGRGNLRVADISNPEDPIVLSTLPGVGCPNMTLEGSILFGAYANGPGGGLIAVDIANPSSPVLVQHLQTSDQLQRLVVRGGVAFCAADFRGLAVYDVSQPWKMQSIGSAGIEFPYLALGVDVIGNHLYLAEALPGLYSSRGRLEIFDISDPTNPFAVGQVQLPTEIYDVVVDGSIAYVAGSQGGLYVVDVADPEAPAFVGGADLPGKAIDVAVSESAVYVACWEGGLQVLPLQCTPTTGLPTPEPGVGGVPRLEITAVGGVVAHGGRAQFSFVLPSAGEVRVGIYNPQGRLIRSLISDRLDGGTHLATWDGRDARGRRAAAGTYFAGITWKRQSAAARLISLP